MNKAKLPTETVDENGEPIKLTDESGNPIKELAFLASMPHNLVHSKEEKLIKHNRRLIIVSVCLFLAFLCFFALFIFSQNQYKERCNELFTASVTNSINLMNKCNSSEFDYDTNYRELTGELNIVRKMSFTVTDVQDNQKTLTDVYYLSIKLPAEYKKYLPDIINGFKYIKDGQDDKGFSTLSAIMGKVDLLNY